MARAATRWGSSVTARPRNSRKPERSRPDIIPNARCHASQAFMLSGGLRRGPLPLWRGRSTGLNGARDPWRSDYIKSPAPGDLPHDGNDCPRRCGRVISVDRLVVRPGPVPRRAARCPPTHSAAPRSRAIRFTSRSRPKALVREDWNPARSRKRERSRDQLIDEDQVPDPQRERPADSGSSQRMLANGSTATDGRVGGAQGHHRDGAGRDASAAQAAGRAPRGGDGRALPRAPRRRNGSPCGISADQPLRLPLSPMARRAAERGW